MANEIKLEVYTLRVRRSSSQDYLPLDDLDGSDFYEIFQEYLTFLNVLDIHDNIKRAIRLQDDSLVFMERRRKISGIFESGGYGIESNIYALADSSHKATKETDDVEIMPFYFLIHVPRNMNVGFLIIQRTGIHGISTIVKSSLYRYVRGAYPNLVIEFNPLISRDLVDEFLNNGRIKEIILRRYALPEDKAEVLTMGEYSEDILAVELRIKAKTFFDRFTNRINRYLADPNGRFFDIPELSDIGFDNYSQIAVVSQYDGISRTMDLSDVMKIRPYYNIDREVDKNVNGHPDFQSIDHLAKSILRDLSSEIE